VAEKIEQVMWAEENYFPIWIFIQRPPITLWASPLSNFTRCLCVSGWSAHIIEQCDNHKLFQPDADYGAEIKTFLLIDCR